MITSNVRLKGITIKNFKNVVNGTLDFEHGNNDYKANILGLYGQNGSGKTALIDALAILQCALRGIPVPAQYAEYINVDAEFAELHFEFRLDDSEHGNVYLVNYEFKLKKELQQSDSNTDIVETAETKYRAVLLDEVLSYSCKGNNNRNLYPIIDTNTADVFVPHTKYLELVGKTKDKNKDRETQTNLLFAKKFAAAASRSFVFSRELLEVIRANENANEMHLFVIDHMVYYGNFELFVINTTQSGLISLNVLPISINYNDSSSKMTGNVILELNEPTVLPDTMAEIVGKVIDTMNNVLTQIVPGLTISTRELEKQTLKNGEIGTKIEIISHRNGKQIPLQYESEGIKKIISVLHLLITVYNNPSVTVAIDELDAGVFEYLLGELLRIISEKGKGQLIFTSHNLRPLETLNKCFIAFTTTNPMNRYIRMNNVKTNHNLRDFYYRDILLGEQSEPVYEMTHNSEIAFAFREAGMNHGS